MKLFMQFVANINLVNVRLLHFVDIKTACTYEINGGIYTVTKFLRADIERHRQQRFRL